VAYESAILNPEAHRSLARAVADGSADVLIVKVGSSHVLYGGNGQLDNCIKSLFDMGKNIVVSPPLGPSEGGYFSLGGAVGDQHSLPDTGTEGIQVAPNTWGTGQGVGYQVTSVATATRAALSLIPAGLHTYIVKGWDGAAEQNPGFGHMQPWVGSATRSNNSIGPQTGGVADVIGQNSNLRGWVASGCDPTLTGNISIGWRQASPNAQIKSASFSAGRATGVYADYIDLDDDESNGAISLRQFPSLLNLQVSNTLGTLSKLCALGALIENRDYAHGFGCGALVAYSGGSVRRMVLQLINSFRTTLNGTAFMTLLASSRVGKEKWWVFDLTGGHNDQNDTTISYDGVNNSNTPAGFLANIVKAMDELTYAAGLFGVSPNRVLFRIRVDTPVSFPDDADLVAYRAVLADNLSMLTQRKALVHDAMDLGSEADYEDWWVNPGVDQVHLNATGYFEVEDRQNEGWLGAMENLLTRGSRTVIMRSGRHGFRSRRLG
jgi:hypothetical protein